MSEESRQRDIDLLNAFLCRERSAYEAYKVGLEAISDVRVSRALVRLRSAHQQRVRELDRRIRALGGTPRTHSSVWSDLARATDDGTESLDEQVLLRALAEYSSRMLRSYRRSLRDMSPVNRAFIEQEILPDSQHLHASVISLESMVSAGVAP